MKSTADGLTLRDILHELTSRDPSREVVTAVHRIPPREARWAPMPAWVRPELKEAYGGKGIHQLYSHQAAAAERVREGKHVVVVTPTASGKTLCYNLPVLNAMLENPDARALYLFPTKALSQDQMEELHDISRRMGDSFGVFTYDGDTPSDARRSVRAHANIVVTNPDMLHTGILPHHTKWTRLFENLQYVVIDELHTYRGVFGSHLANILRRLRRVLAFYGREPRFICCSATIANPGELAARLLEADVDLVDGDGAPSAEKFLVFHNPPVVNRFLGIRRGCVREACRLAQRFIQAGYQTIVFANSRLNTELTLAYLREANPRRPGDPESIYGYRGGYLPGERRAIERRLREGKIRAVAATNALELGIDIGSLDVSILAGYPGTIASTWQRAGRAGRRSGSSCAVLVASSQPLDQFMVRHPDYFLSASPEHAYIEPDNLEILVNHLKCAAFELPLSSGERFGGTDLAALCGKLEEAGFLHRSEDYWYWTHEAYPADTISLRSVTSDNFVIVDETQGPEVIGEVDFTSALTMVHPKAIYMHLGRQHHVERLDFEHRKAYVRRVDVDYFTQAIRYTQVRILDVAQEKQVTGPGTLSHGDVLVRSQVVGFKKIKLSTGENVGSGNLELPENEMHTTSYWLTLPPGLLESLPFTRSERQDGLAGLLHALESVACLLLMCDRMDLGATVGEGGLFQGPESSVAARPVPGEPLPEHFNPTVFLYDAYPGGIGLSEPLYQIHERLVRHALDLITGCACENGCPSCVGPAAEVQSRAKDAACAILRQLVSAT